MVNSISVYTAGPIDLAGDDQIDWRSTLQQELQNEGIAAVLFNPATAFMSSKWGVPAQERASYIETVNSNALLVADIFVAVVPSNKFSMGVPVEIDMAKQHNMNMFVISDIPYGKSAYLDNRIDPSRLFTVSDWSTVEVEMAVVSVVKGILSDMANSKD